MFHVSPVARSKSTGRTVPAPVGGWNARDSEAMMPETDALRLDNWLPDTASVKIRKGHSSHATGVTDGVETLWNWASGGSSKLRAAGNDAIYDVTSGGAVGAALKSSMLSNRFQWVAFNTYVIAVNGENDPIKDSGTVVDDIGDGAESAITGSGLTAADLIHVNVFKSRLFFVEKNTMNVWYLAANAIGGTATKLDFSTLTDLGGEMAAMGTWTRDGGDGMDDLAVFITTEGEVIVYQGTDPSAASTWALVGVYKLGRPIGRRCLLSIGPDLIVITEDGFMPLSRVLGSDRVDTAYALSDKIRNALSTAVGAYKANFGWQAVHYPLGRYGIFNIPISSVESHQYILNTTTGAWCRFTNQNALCWVMHQGEPYFGSADGAVYQANDGTSDNTATINADVETAFSYFGAPGRLKKWTMARPMMRSDGAINASLILNTDFRRLSAGGFITPVATAGGVWGVAEWGVAEWASGNTVQTSWQTVRGVGFNASLRIQLKVSAQDVEWLATDYVYEHGGFV